MPNNSPVFVQSALNNEVLDALKCGGIDGKHVAIHVGGGQPVGRLPPAQGGLHIAQAPGGGAAGREPLKRQPS